MADPVAMASAGELLAGLRGGDLRSEELVGSAIRRIREVNPRYNAVVAVDEAGALARARAADAAAGEGRVLGPLHGLPMTVKDCFEVAGLPAVNGVRELVDYRPQRHALAVQRLVDAGAIVIGKTNVPAHSLDLQTYNDVFGVTCNPWNPARTPGGSSGGAAVALATGVTCLEIGSDLAGSLRLPAHATGVCSLKPSYGLVPTAGVMAPHPGMLRTPDLLVVGPMARCVADLGLLLDVLAGPAPREAAAWQLRLPQARAAGTGLRVAAWLDDENCPVSADVAEVLGGAVTALGRAGFRIDGAARPGIPPAEQFRLFLRLMYAEMSAGFPDNVFRAFELAVRRTVREGAWTALSVMPEAVTQSHRQWLVASEAREACRAAWAEFFTRFDVLVAPVAPTTALPHDHRPFEQRTITLRGREHAYMQQSFWCALATLAGLPAAVVPAGVAPDGLPVGLQVIGPFLGERTVLEFAACVEQALGTLACPLS